VIWTFRRLADVRLFARHTLDPRTKVPPADLLPAHVRRATPYLYTPQKVADLMRITVILRRSHVQATYRALIGLLAVSISALARMSAATARDESSGSRR